MALAVKQMRERLKAQLEKLRSVQGCEVMAERVDEWIATMNDGEKNKQATADLIDLLENYNGANAEALEIRHDVLKN